MSYNDNSYAFYRAQKIVSFNQGRSFRSFKKLSIPAMSTYVVKVVVPIPVDFTKFDINIDAGTLEVETVVGGTADGTFAETLPVFKTNLKYNTAYVGQVALTAGGIHTGGTIIDISRQKTDGNSTRGSSVIQGDSDIRGIAVGTYHWRFVNLSNDVVTGTVKIEWNEPEF